MTYLAVSSVQIDTWVRIGADTEICYEVTPAHDDVVVTIGGPDGLTLNMREAALRRCVHRRARGVHRRPHGAAEAIISRLGCVPRIFGALVSPSSTSSLSPG